MTWPWSVRIMAACVAFPLAAFVVDAATGYWTWWLNVAAGLTGLNALLLVREVRRLR